MVPPARADVHQQILMNRSRRGKNAVTRTALKRELIALEERNAACFIVMDANRFPPISPSCLTCYGRPQNKKPRDIQRGNEGRVRGLGAGGKRPVRQLQIIPTLRPKSFAGAGWWNSESAGSWQ
jgi:hypothetical protein